MSGSEMWTGFLPAVGHEAERWSVYRRYLEFYVLESKLTEFHGKKFISVLFSLTENNMNSLMMNFFLFT